MAAKASQGVKVVVPTSTSPPRAGSLFRKNGPFTDKELQPPPFGGEHAPTKLIQAPPLKNVGKSRRPANDPTKKSVPVKRKCA